MEEKINKVFSLLTSDRQPRPRLLTPARSSFSTTQLSPPEPGWNPPEWPDITSGPTLSQHGERLGDYLADALQFLTSGTSMSGFRFIDNAQAKALVDLDHADIHRFRKALASLASCTR